MEELKLQVEELKREIEIMKNAQNLDQNELLFNYISTNKGIAEVGSIANYSSDLQRTIDTGTTPVFAVPENPINTAIIKIGNNYYRILLYSLT